jgi:hypothetical protein
MDLVATSIILAVTLCGAMIALWMAGAIYYDVGRGTGWGLSVAAGWMVAVASLFVTWQPIWQPFVVLLGVFVLFLGCWLRQKPSHDRDWEPTVAVLPRALRDGDSITIENVRNFEYRSLNDFTPRYETRKFHLGNLQAVDIIFFTWGSPWMSHPVLVFDFGPDGRICMSIEVRYRRGQQFSFIRSLYRQQELIFLAADERDIILRRTRHGNNEEGHLYRLNVTPELMRTSFLDYIDTINNLHALPRWYHGLCANCTTSFYRLPNSGRRFDWRVLANGRLDRALYADGRLDRTLPFQELERVAFLNDVANSAPQVGFGDHVRCELERRRHEQ